MNWSSCWKLFIRNTYKIENSKKFSASVQLHFDCIKLHKCNLMFVLTVTNRIKISLKLQTTSTSLFSKWNFFHFLFFFFFDHLLYNYDILWGISRSFTQVEIKLNFAASFLFFTRAIFTRSSTRHCWSFHWWANVSLDVMWCNFYIVCLFFFLSFLFIWRVQKSHHVRSSNFFFPRALVKMNRSWCEWMRSA